MPARFSAASRREDAFTVDTNLPVLAGTLSTVIFLFSALPMLRKAARTRDLRSYSPGTIMLANAGNVIHTVYVVSLPMGPIWALHTFYLLSTALMLVWYLRYEGLTIPGAMRRTSLRRHPTRSSPPQESNIS
jgi:hypothetical protein